MYVFDNYLRIIITAFLIACFAFNQAYSQHAKKYEISGIVLDKETGEPIPTANVYISQTTIGTYTKHDGTFDLKTNLKGIHTLVVSYIGYKAETRELNLYSDTKTYFEIMLIVDPVEMDEVEITASNDEWRDHFNFFREKFIGTTRIADDTKIENPWLVLKRMKMGIWLHAANAL